MALLLAAATLHAQQAKDSLSHWQFSGYGELYYSYDFSNPAGHEKAAYLYNHKRHNELNLNLAFARAAYTAKRLRSNVALMVGNYAEYNLSNEPAWARFLYEANMGIKITAKTNTWLEAGIFPSHIGFESAISADCPTLTRSLVAENSPYYEAGVRLNHTNRNGTLVMNLLLLNGWQHIRKPDGMQYPALGMQVNYQPSANVQLNYSNFIGSDKPDSLNTLRIYQDVYAILKPHPKVSVTAGFDLGMESAPGMANAYWYSPVLILQYILNSRNRIALRCEHFEDGQEAVIAAPNGNGFSLSGLSLNADHIFYDRVCWRVEGKVFSPELNLAGNNYSLTSNISIRF